MQDEPILIFNTVPVLDALALVWFAVGVIGYTLTADNIAWGRRPMAVVLDDYRLRWMERMLERDNRMPDVQIIAAYIRSGGLFISTTLLVLAGVVALLGQIEDLRQLIYEVSMGQTESKRMLEIKVFVLLVIFVYAFFKFAWCLRQFNYTLVLIGAAPVAQKCTDAIRAAYPPRLAAILGRAVNNYNRGLRSYYFALALLPWFLHPLFLMVTTVWVIVVLSRRDFRSVTLRTLADLGEEAHKDES